MALQANNEKAKRLQEAARNAKETVDPSPELLERMSFPPGKEDLKDEQRSTLSATVKDIT